MVRVCVCAFEGFARQWARARARAEAQHLSPTLHQTPKSGRLSLTDERVEEAAEHAGDVARKHKPVGRDGAVEDPRRAVDGHRRKRQRVDVLSRAGVLRVCGRVGVVLALLRSPVPRVIIIAIISQCARAHTRNPLPPHTHTHTTQRTPR